ncbi:uncharacterized protein N7515_009438 [Penicillium bovifimosum]|uniref:Uncharacterized protein n=1 Tax=Penicillium bovifimosum TaxID=126998 RepID=A0A9W9KVI2_9EURO|nr:uncharacterized protein N7515_009438 [Penicillium bovifimosum]KAJ5121477.1 hypothetical protein N7515_009438 [Penicillium bovifimosum]
MEEEERTLLSAYLTPQEIQAAKDERTPQVISTEPISDCEEDEMSMTQLEARSQPQVASQAVQRPAKNALGKRRRSPPADHMGDDEEIQPRAASRAAQRPSNEAPSKRPVTTIADCLEDDEEEHYGDDEENDYGQESERMDLPEMQQRVISHMVSWRASASFAECIFGRALDSLRGNSGLRPRFKLCHRHFILFAVADRFRRNDLRRSLFLRSLDFLRRKICR